MKKSASIRNLNASRASHNSSERNSVSKYRNGIIDMTQSSKDKSRSVKKRKNLLPIGQQYELSDTHQHSGGQRPGGLSPISISNNIPSYVQSPSREESLSFLIQEASRIVHVPLDLSKAKSLKTKIDKEDLESLKHSLAAKGAQNNQTFQEMKQKLQKTERMNYENSLRLNLAALLAALDIPNSEELIEQRPSMEEIAIEVKKRFFQQHQKSADIISSRLIKKEPSNGAEENDEIMRENKRLKELVVKLQNEINENLKKSTEQRIKELVDENENQKRKIADLIDQLKRKEQEILLIPVGKVAQSRIDGLESEKKELLKRISELTKAYQEEIATIEEKLFMQMNNQHHEFVPQITADPSIDLQMIRVIKEQQQHISELTEKLQSQREEINSKSDLLERLEEEKKTALERLESLQELFYLETAHGEIGPSSGFPAGNSQEFYSLNRPVQQNTENIEGIKKDLNHILLKLGEVKRDYNK